MELKIIDMYPDILNLYGDVGNLISIKKRCEWRGIDIKIENFTIGNETDIQDADIVLIGGGSDNGQNIISNHFLNQKNNLENYIEDGKVILAICGSYQMFGNSYINPYNEKIPCLEIFDLETESRKDRLTGNILISNNLNMDSNFDNFAFDNNAISSLDDIIGFENHGGRTFHKYDALGNVKVGFGNNGEDGKEGLIYKNFIGSYLHGPILPKNPHIADHMIFTALKNKYGDSLEENIFQLKDFNSNGNDSNKNDSIEIDAHNVMKQRLLKSID